MTLASTVSRIKAISICRFADVFLRTFRGSEEHFRSHACSYLPVVYTLVYKKYREVSLWSCRDVLPVHTLFWSHPVRTSCTNMKIAQNAPTMRSKKERSRSIRILWHVILLYKCIIKCPGGMGEGPQSHRTCLSKIVKSLLTKIPNLACPNQPPIWSISSWIATMPCSDGPVALGLYQGSL